VSSPYDSSAESPGGERRARRRRWLLFGSLGCLGLFALLLLVFLGLIVIGYVVGRGVRPAMEEGEALGRTSTDRECFDTARKREAERTGRLMPVDAMFLQACLAVATPTDDFCVGVSGPKALEAACGSLEERRLGCAMLMGTAELHCNER